MNLKSLALLLNFLKSRTRPNNPWAPSDLGTRIQTAAWNHASPFVTEYLTLRASMSEYEQSCLEISTVARLSLADAVVLVQFMGLTSAGRFVSLVDR